MIKKIKNIFYISSFFIFIILTSSFYFSDKNINNTNKTRSLYSVQSNKKYLNIPLLKNDTKNVIEYSNDVEKYKKRKKKYEFFKLLN